MKESSSIQSGWREGKENLRETGRRHQVPSAAVCTCAHARCRCLPEQVEHGGEEQLVVDGDAHVARLVEGRGHRPDGGPQGASPAQEQKLG